MSPIHVSTSLCISGSSASSMSPDPQISIDMFLRILCKIHVSGSISQHLFISGSSGRSMSPDSCLSIFLSQDPLQDPCLRIHVSHSCLSIHQYGSSTRSMSSDSCLSIFVSQDPLQDPCLRIHVLASTYMDPLQDPRLRAHVSASLYLMDSLQDPSLRIHVSASFSQEPLQDPCLWIHVSASICTSARSMSLDPYISIHMYLRILCKIHLSDSCLSIFTSQDPLQDPCLRIHVSASLCLRIL